MISALLIEIIFGSSFSSPYIQESIVYRSKKCVIMYFNSYNAINTLLNINNLSPIDFMRKKLRYICCGKVNVKKNDRNITGYVLDEDQYNLKVLLRDDLCIKVKKPKIISFVGTDEKIKTVLYQYEEITADNMDRYVITEFWPIRIRIMKNAMDNMIYLINRLVLKEDIKIHQVLSS